MRMSDHFPSLQSQAALLEAPAQDRRLQLFRDGATWRLLHTLILPEILSHKLDRPIRIWCTGAHAEEDALSALVDLTQRLGVGETGRRIRLFATGPRAGRSAGPGYSRYTPAQLDSLSDRQRDACFEPAPGVWTVRSDLRRVLVTGDHDLLRQAPLTSVDLVLCSLRLEHLSGSSVPVALKRLHFGLARKGCLVVDQGGRATVQESGIYDPVVPGAPIFRKVGKPDVRSLKPHMLSFDRRTANAADPAAVASPAEARRGLAHEAVHAAAIELQAALEEMEEQNQRLQRLSEELALSNARQAAELSSLRAEVGQLSAALRNLPHPVMMVRDDGRLAACSTAAADLCGEQSDGLTGRLLDALIDGPVPSAQDLSGQQEPGKPVVIRLRHRDGSCHEVLGQALALSVAGARLQLLTLRPDLAPDLPADRAVQDGDHQPAPGLQQLTPRERDVLNLLIHGQQSKQIAHTLGISRRTVDVHRSSLFRKTGSRNLADLLRMTIGENRESAAVNQAAQQT